MGGMLCQAVPASDYLYHMHSLKQSHGMHGMVRTVQYDV